MIRFILFLACILPATLFAQPFSKEEISQWKKRSERVAIIRDKWGVPHIYAKTDADVVFGLLYVQCEDDFPRVEWNYVTALGRGAEVRGEEELYNDLVTRMLSDTLTAIAR